MKEEVNLNSEIFIENMEKLHTTTLGIQRLQNNLLIKEKDVVRWCKNKIKQSNAKFKRQGKNYYIRVDDYEITVNANTFTIITGHIKK